MRAGYKKYLAYRCDSSELVPAMAEGTRLVCIGQNTQHCFRQIFTPAEDHEISRPGTLFTDDDYRVMAMEEHLTRHSEPGMEWSDLRTGHCSNNSSLNMITWTIEGSDEMAMDGGQEAPGGSSNGDRRCEIAWTIDSS
jgi:hypothetical protein